MFGEVHLKKSRVLTTWRIVNIAVAAATLWPICAEAQPYAATPVRRQFVSVSYDWLYTWPLHFADHPLADLLGTGVGGADPPYDYQTRDGSTLIDVLAFKRRGHGVGVTVYPFGMSVGPTLGLRGSIENLPDIRIVFDGPGTLDSYALTNALAYDVGAGLYVADRAPGWGLGSYAFILGGVGRITSDLGGGSRYFAEGGGGVQSGPIGFEISAKFGWNRLSDPVEHRFLTVPITMRATVSF
jgi:hypothetical protein